MMPSYSNRLNRLSRTAVLAAMALAVQWLESFLPSPFPMIPVRIGFANIFVLYALLIMTPQESLLIAVLRCMLLPMITGNVSGMLYGLSGSLFSWLLMVVLLKIYRKGAITEIGLSIAGAFAFQIGQTVMGTAVVGRVIWFYFTYMALLSIPAGAATGWLCGVLKRRLEPEKSTKENDAAADC